MHKLDYLSCEDIQIMHNNKRTMSDITISRATEFGHHKVHRLAQGSLEHTCCAVLFTETYNYMNKPVGNWILCLAQSSLTHRP